MNGEFVISGPNPNYSYKLYIEINLEILDIFNVKNPKIVMTKKSPIFEHTIT